MDRISTFLIVSGVTLAVSGIVVMGGTTFGEWFAEDFRSTATYIAAAAPVVGLALLGMGGSRVPSRALSVRTGEPVEPQA